MDIKDIAIKIDQLGETQQRSLKTQAVLENEMQNLSKTMERFADILTRQVEIETDQRNMREDINHAFDAIRVVQENGTMLCGEHNAQFAKYHEQCNAKGEHFSEKIEDIEDKIKVRDARFMKIATVISSPIYLYIISKILNL